MKANEYDRIAQELIGLQGKLTISERQNEEFRKSAEIKASELSGIISRLEADLRDKDRSRSDSQFELTNTIARLEAELREAKRSK